MTATQELTRPGAFSSQITFLYYTPETFERASAFYEHTLGLHPVEDQGWARIFAAAPGAFIGIVDERRGSLKAKPDSAVLLTLVVDDVSAWHDYLKARDVPILRGPDRNEEIQVEHCFIEDPGGYRIELQTFLKPELQRIFRA